ncbi:hypothetical protein OS187_11915 [Xanthomonadaceae bacterium JHOS43]|nr:hypothetical protein [Xanthomonadaceae bacterium JHOS43]
MSVTRTLLAAALLAAYPLAALSGVDPKPARSAATVKAVQEKGDARLSLVVPDVVKLRAEDEIRDAKPGTPLRYGVVQSVWHDVHAKNGPGEWLPLPRGRWLWRMEVNGKGASSLEFTFSRFRLPHGAELVIRSADGSQRLASLTDADNPEDGSALHTAMIQSDAVVLELTVPASKRDYVELELANASYGYRDPFAASQAKSGSCNIDTACPEGDEWREQIASVAGYAFQANASSLYCTGTLMNTGDVGADAARPRFATAHHCVSTPQEVASMVFYWGYESPACRTPGGAANGTSLPVLPNTLSVQTGGATLLATDRATDFTAVEINTPIPDAAQVFYSGWDRSGSTPPGAVGIHHPSGNEKRISFNEDPLTTMQNCIISSSDTTTHWRVDDWELGTTERGSSGSGLWNPANGLLVGVLSGGTAACSNPAGYDCYGRLSTAWEAPGTTGGHSIRDAFDRTGTNPQTMPGKGTCDAPVVTLTANAFANAPRAGSKFQIRASATGGAGGYTYLWDVDGDGVVEREGPERHIMVSIPKQHSGNVRVQVRDAEGCVGTAAHALDVLGATLEVVSTGTPHQVCGNGDGRIDPGERYSVPVTFRNVGTAPMAGSGQALFAAGGGLAVDLGPNQFGYVGSSSCSYQFIDLAEGEWAVDPLDTYAADGNAYGPRDDARTPTITLGGEGIALYGERYSEAAMSTNGYVSFDPDDGGSAGSINGDELSCDGGLPEGSLGPQLRPFHDDLRVREDAGAGLRYRHFEVCPRASLVGQAQGCHVFQWTGMETYGASSFMGETEFQAVVYEQSGEVVYQYKTSADVDESYTVIGFVDQNGDDAMRMGCPLETGNVPAAQSAICAFAPTALPAGDVALRLEQPTVPLRTLRMGSSFTVNVPVQVRADAACGTSLSLDYIASAIPRSHSTRSSRHAIGAVADDCAVVASCPAQVVEIDAIQGNYHNPFRPGNSFNSYPFGGTWYTGSADHAPFWYQTSGSYIDHLLDAPLQRVTRVATPSSVGARSEQVGQVRVARIDGTRAMLAWQFNDGRAGAELMQLTHTEHERAEPDYTGRWIAFGEPDWGVEVESVVIDQRRFDNVLAYLFDAQGNPRWVISEGAINDGMLDLASYRTHCPGCPAYANWETRTRSAGQFILEFDDADNATLSTDIDLPAPLQGQWQRIEVPLIRAGEPTP